MFATGGLRIDQAPPLHLPLRFFVTGPLFLLFSGILCIIYGSDLLIVPLMPVTVATVHVIVLGWISMVMFGAFYQMIPVLVGLPVPWPQCGSWVHASLVIGVVTLFLGIATDLHRWLLLAASAGLGIAISLFLLPVFTALFKAPVQHTTVTSMRIATLSLLGVLTLGGVFLGEYAHGFLSLDRPTLVGIHLLLGLFGWVSMLIIGVSFQVIPMFYMTPEFPKRDAHFVLGGFVLSLFLLPASLFFSPHNPLPVWLAALPGLAALIGYGRRIATMLKQKKRRQIDLTYRFWLLGFVCGAVAVVLLALWPIVPNDRLRFLFGVLFLFGFASSILVGMLYKIVPFLVWFHRFSKLAGLVDVPMMDDLVPNLAMRLQFPVHLFSVMALLGAVLSDWQVLVQLSGAGLIVSAGLLLYTLWYALRQKPPSMPEMPDFASFFKDSTGQQPF